MSAEKSLISSGILVKEGDSREKPYGLTHPGHQDLRAAFGSTSSVVAWFYDTVARVFRANAGSGTITAGDLII